MSFYVIIRGPLGCGKSTIVRNVSKRIGARTFSIDKILNENDLEKDREEGYISQKSFKKVNQIIAPKVKDILKSGKPVIFDGNFYWKSQIENLIARLNFPYYIFTLKTPLEVCIERDKNRNNTIGKDAAEAVFNKTTEFEYGTIIDVNRSLDKCVDEIISYLPN